MSILIALPAGFILDLLLGDPPRWPHIVVVMGKAVERLERLLRRVFPATPKGELAGGGVLVCAMLTGTLVVSAFVLALAGQAHPALRAALECLVCFQVLATKSLRDAALRVHAALARGDLGAAREAVGMIVGRDTAALDASGVARAAVETAAENTSDGVVAPMLFFAAGGAPLALAYKAINTMDSMIGYKNEKYLHFGRAAARLDDAANFLPARLTALLMITAAAPCGLDRRGALRIWLRDRNATTSPNAGHPEAACAGALGIRLGGDALYGGRPVRKPFLGDALREIEADDIRRAARLLRACAVLSLFLCAGGVFAWRGVLPWI